MEGVNIFLDKLKITNRKKLLPEFIVVGFLFVFSVQLANADPLDTIVVSPGVTLNGNLLFDIIESEDDVDCTEGGGPPISVTITSTMLGGGTRDSITMDAIEIDDPGLRLPFPGSCIFGNTELRLAPEDQRFSIGDTIQVTQQATAGLGTITVTVKSTSDVDGISLTLTETGPTTGIYQNIVLLTNDSSVPDSAIMVAPGDIITVTYITISSYAQVLPSPNGSVGFLVADLDDTITLTYDGLSESTVVITGGGGGAGGGGPVLPSLSLVIDVLAGVLGGGGADRTPPSLVSSNPSILGSLFAPDPFKPISPTTNPTATLRINDDGFFPTGYANTINPEHVNTGENVALTLSFTEASTVQHVALHLVDANHDEMSDTDPMITFDNGNVVKSDPDGILGDQITFSTARDGTHSTFHFGFSFDQPTNRHLMITVWDEKKNSVNTKIFDAFSVSGQPIPKEENHLVLQDLGQYVITQDGVVDMQAQNNPVPQQQAGWFYSKSLGRLDRHDMTSLHSTIDNEQTRADIITDNFNLDTKTFVAKDTTKPYDTKRAPQLTWSNVGHHLRDPTKTPDENKELLKQLLWQEHLKAEKTLKSLFVKNTYHYED